MNALHVLFVGLVCVSLAHCQAVKYKDCGSQVGEIEKVEVFPCTAFPCQLHKGQSYTVNVTFTISETTDQSFAKVYGIVSGVQVPFPLKYPDACAGESGLTCPLQSGSSLVYTASLPVLSVYPAIKVLVKWELNDKSSSGNMIFCMETLVQIVD